MIRKNLFVSILVSSLMLGANLSGVSADEVSPASKNSSKAPLKAVCAGFGTYGIISGTASFLKYFKILTGGVDNRGNSDPQNTTEGTPVDSLMEEMMNKNVLHKDRLGKYIGEPEDAKSLAFWLPAVAKAVAGIGGIVTAVLS